MKYTLMEHKDRIQFYLSEIEDKVNRVFDHIRKDDIWVEEQESPEATKLWKDLALKMNDIEKQFINLKDPKVTKAAFTKASKALEDFSEDWSSVLKKIEGLSRMASRKKRSAVRVENNTRQLANTALDRAGFGGRRMFRSPGEGLSEAFGVLAKFGIEQDEVLNSFLFRKEKGQLAIQLAFTNEEDSFSPTSITENLLAFQWTEINPNRFEIIAYVS